MGQELQKGLNVDHMRHFLSYYWLLVYRSDRSVSLHFSELLQNTPHLLYCWMRVILRMLQIHEIMLVYLCNLFMFSNMNI